MVSVRPDVAERRQASITSCVRRAMSPHCGSGRPLATRVENVRNMFVSWAVGWLLLYSGTTTCRVRRRMSKSQPSLSKTELVTSKRTSSPKKGSTKSGTWTRPFVPLTTAHCSFSVRNEQ